MIYVRAATCLSLTLFSWLMTPFAFDANPLPQDMQHLLTTLLENNATTFANVLSLMRPSRSLVRTVPPESKRRGYLVDKFLTTAYLVWNIFWKRKVFQQSHASFKGQEAGHASWSELFG
jgi:hypothetical protein